jgi:hypothetical protein
MSRIIFIVFLLSTQVAFSQAQKWQGKFEQLEHLLPTPNEYRSGSGAPGPGYWQQQADYVISVELNDDNQSITGSETITYHNNSPDVLKYLWLQLDQNIISDDNTLKSSDTDKVVDSAAAKSYATKLSDFEGGYNIKSVKDGSGKALPFFINNTMMRVTLAEPLKSGQKFAFSIDIPSLSFSRGCACMMTMTDGRTNSSLVPESLHCRLVITKCA